MKATNPYERACEIAAGHPPAISGQDGHGTTFSLACKLVNGCELSHADALSVLREYNRRCQPEWSDGELDHKVRQAFSANHDMPRGYLLNGGRSIGGWPISLAGLKAPEVPREPEAPKANYDTSAPAVLPAPMNDPARALLLAAFLPGERIGIVTGRINKKDGRCQPTGAGDTLTREEWLAKLDSHEGDPNRVLSMEDGGAFIRVNPITENGKSDKDVTAFRHTLIEFDHAAIETQWSLLTQSNIPCTAILHSGGKSLHAWVRIDAKDAKEYATRVKILYAHFADYGLDEKNKNASRFSRLPGINRGEPGKQTKQQLLAIKTGAESFDRWLVDKAAEGIGQHITIREMLEFEPEKDFNSVLGKRWLCKGGSCLWIGQSGIGKSVILMQAAIAWATGDEFFGVRSSHGRELKSLIVQAENDVGDMAEMLSGVIEPMAADGKGGPKLVEQLSRNIVIVREQIHTGERFAGAIQKLIAKHSPDIVWVDPLLSYIGDDISSQKVCSQFLRNWLNPISEATGVIWMVVHHTGKPSNDPKARKGWTSSDHAYVGTGSSELVNWARAVNVITRLDDYTFKLMFAKRGRRAGAKDLDRNFTSDIYLQHSEVGLRWEQVLPPVEEEEKQEKRSAGRPKAIFDASEFAASLAGKGEMTPTQVVSLLSKKLKVHERTAFRYWGQVQPLIASFYNEMKEVYEF